MHTDTSSSQLGRTLALAFAVLVATAASSRAQQITYFQAGRSFEIVAGPDGRLWFPIDAFGAIGRISTSGVLDFISVPNGGTDITVGPDGNLWYSTGVNKIGRVSPAGDVTEFPLGSGVDPSSVTAGPDGKIWLTDIVHNAIGRMTLSGVVTMFPIPTPVSLPTAITPGPDGNLWFTEGQVGKIGRITTSGVITEFPLPDSNGGPHRIVAGPDGNLWFTQPRGGRIGRMTPSGTLTEFSLPNPNSQPAAITVGPDGNLWYTNFSFPSRIGRITPNGVMTEFAVPSPGGLAAGPDGNIWFTDTTLNRVGRLNIAGLGACVGGISALCLNGNRFRLEVRFTAPGQVPQDGQAILLSSDTGAFWFFSASNLELMIKVLDGRAINGRFWVFYGSLSDVEYTITVIDTETGAIKSYSNPQGRIASVADTNAF